MSLTDYHTARVATDGVARVTAARVTAAQHALHAAVQAGVQDLRGAYETLRAATVAAHAATVLASQVRAHILDHDTVATRAALAARVAAAHKLVAGAAA